MPMIIAENYFDITDKDDFIISNDSPKLPVDRHGIPVMIDDILHLRHNNRFIKVRLMHYKAEYNCWLIFGYNENGWTSHGGFSLPESQNNIEHAYFLQNFLNGK